MRFRIHESLGKSSGGFSRNLPKINLGPYGEFCSFYRLNWLHFSCFLVCSDRWVLDLCFLCASPNKWWELYPSTNRPRRLTIDFSSSQKLPSSRFSSLLTPRYAPCSSSSSLLHSHMYEYVFLPIYICVE